MLLLSDEVLSPDLNRIQACLAREQIHDPLDQEGGLRAPRASIGIGRRAVREYADPPTVERLHPVGALGHQQTDDHEGPELAAVGAEIEPLGDADTQERAVLLGGDFHVPQLRAAVMRGTHVLVAVLDPLDGPAQFLGGERRQQLLGVDADLRAKTAPHVWSHHPDLALRNAEDYRQEDFHEVRDLS